jgi:hypothetical protein
VYPLDLKVLPIQYTRQSWPSLVHIVNWIADRSGRDDVLVNGPEPRPFMISADAAAVDHRKPAHGHRDPGLVAARKQ